MKDKKQEFKKTPLFAEKILQIMLSFSEKEGLSGDFEEMYNDCMYEKGWVRAWLWYWCQILAYLPRFICSSIGRSLDMFHNYLKIVLRNFRKQKGYSFINILGLALGMACFFTITLFILHEMSYDQYHENCDRIYRIAVNGNFGERNISIPLTMNPLGPTLAQEFPEVKDFVRFRNLGETLLEYREKEKQFFERGFFYTDSSVFDVFSFSLVKGDSEAALRDPYTVVINQEVADKFFGTEDPMGKLLNYNGQFDLKVTGVMKNVPENSHFHPRILASYATLYELVPQQMSIWLSLNYYTYLLLEDHVDPDAVVLKFPAFFERHMGAILKQFGLSINPYLQPLKDIHLRSNLNGELEENLDITYISIFTAIALFVLMIASINFMNLSTARSANRAQEVGLRKVLGADRKDMIKQFLGESILMSIFAFNLAMVLTVVLFPFFNSISGRDLPVDSLINVKMILSFLLIAILVGFTSGGYPAFFLSSYQPIKVMRGNLKSGTKSSIMRSILVTWQFSISIILIIGASIIFQQISFLKNTPLGFEKEHIISVPLRNQKVEVLRNRLKSIPGVVQISAVSQIPGLNFSADGFIPEGMNEAQPWAVSYLATDHEFLETMDIKIIEGRSFSREFQTDEDKAILINEAAVRKLGWEKSVGKTIALYGGDDRNRSMTVIGVFKDYHYASLREPIEPFFIFIDPYQYNQLLIRIAPNSISSTIEALRNKWSEFGSSQPFVYSFLDEKLDLLYHSEHRLNRIFQSFTLLAIFVACLGLFGLASFTSEQRTKEIGIRKVLGASVAGIILSLTKDFTRWVLLANIVAWPIAYFVMNRWLQNFAYHVDFNIWLFIGSGIGALIIAFLTVSVQSIKAAIANPVQSLKYE